MYISRIHIWLCNSSFNFFFFLLIKTRSYLLLWLIDLYLKVPENFMHFIFKDRFWILHIPFVNMIKFAQLAGAIEYTD